MSLPRDRLRLRGPQLPLPEEGERENISTCGARRAARHAVSSGGMGIAHEVITALTVPPVSSGMKQILLKGRIRQADEFSLAAAVLPGHRGGRGHHRQPPHGRADQQGRRSGRCQTDGDEHV